MSQQTPVTRLAPVWQEWMDRWPGPGQVAQASAAQVIRAWGTLGYPRRALHLREAARMVQDRFGGQVPRTEEELLTLPGVGPYTAAAVMAFGHKERSVVLDTNIRRVLTRTQDGLALPPAHVRVRERNRADRLVPPGPARAASWNAAVMAFGALVCTARTPRCTACPVSVCRWQEAGFPDNAPPRKSQTWHGSIRQLRGQIMGQLRTHYGGMSARELTKRVAGEHPWAAAGDIEQALSGLVADSLIRAEARSGSLIYSLPH